MHSLHVMFTEFKHGGGWVSVGVYIVSFSVRHIHNMYHTNLTKDLWRAILQIPLRPHRLTARVRRFHKKRTCSSVPRSATTSRLSLLISTNPTTDPFALVRRRLDRNSLYNGTNIQGTSQVFKTQQWRKSCAIPYSSAISTFRCRECSNLISVSLMLKCRRLHKEFSFIWARSWKSRIRLARLVSIPV